MNTTTLRTVTLEDATQLAEMLCADTQLRNDLSIADDVRPTATDFLVKVQRWETKRNGRTYAVAAGANPVGIISVHPSSEDSSRGKVGYWVGSQYRGVGYCTDALQQLLAVVADHRMTSLSGTVGKANLASGRVWEKLNAERDPIEEGKCRFTLLVNRQQENR